ncbi:MAG: hypothetical protein Q7S96_04980 [bacterium]|nr:hypothetical protein [bacterium]
MFQSATTRDDPPLTEVEEAVLERLFDLAGAVTEDEIATWFSEDFVRLLPALRRCRMRKRIAECNDYDRRAAVAISRLVSDEQRILSALVARHPHTRFFGFDEAPRLRRACELAALRAPPTPSNA